MNNCFSSTGVTVRDWCSSSSQRHRPFLGERNLWAHPSWSSAEYIPHQSYGLVLSVHCSPVIGLIRIWPLMQRVQRPDRNHKENNMKRSLINWHMRKRVCSLSTMHTPKKKAK